jgi:hypothetical protein
MNLAHGPSEGHNLDPACARLAQSRGGGRGGGPARVDVVHQHDPCRNPTCCVKRASHVASPLCERQAALPPARPGAHEHWADGEAPPPPQLSGKPTGGMVSALQAAVSVGRHEGQRVRLRRCNYLLDDLGGENGHPAEPLLLPRSDQLRHACVVGHGRARRRERETPARALAAACDRPGRGSPATLAHRPRDSAQTGAAASAEDVCGDSAGRAATGEEQIEKRVGTLRADFAPFTGATVSYQS